MLQQIEATDMRRLEIIINKMKSMCEQLDLPDHEIDLPVLHPHDPYVYRCRPRTKYDGRLCFHRCWSNPAGEYPWSCHWSCLKSCPGVPPDRTGVLLTLPFPPTLATPRAVRLLRSRRRTFLFCCRLLF